MFEITNGRVFLLDIEGTTTSISFVKDVLFPFASDNLEKHINANWSDDQFLQDVVLLQHQSIEDSTRGLIEKPLPSNINDPSFKTQMVLYVKNLISNDIKCTALKQLQGHIWKNGFELGLIKGHVYEDVPIALELWQRKCQCEIYIYSSGSIEAQKLLFGHTIHGNLLPFISGHFDTKTGPKQESSSYIKISEAIKRKPEDIVFLTDIPQEAIAAQAAGLTPVIVYRPGNAQVDNEIKEKFPAITSFNDIKFLTPQTGKN